MEAEKSKTNKKIGNLRGCILSSKWWGSIPFTDTNQSNTHFL